MVFRGPGSLGQPGLGRIEGLLMWAYGGRVGGGGAGIYTEGNTGTWVLKTNSKGGGKSPRVRDWHSGE